VLAIIRGNTWPEKCGSVWVRKVRKCVAVYTWARPPVPWYKTTMSGLSEGTARVRVQDVKPAQLPPLDWSAGHVSPSLSALRTYVETEAIKASAWYLAKRGKKRTLGRILRGLGILFTGAAGLFPIISQLWVRDDKPVVAPAGPRCC